MDYYDSAKFYPSFSNEGKVKLYSVFGGIPYYNSLISEKFSVSENIIQLLLADHAPLKDEIPLYLKKEIDKTERRQPTGFPTPYFVLLCLPFQECFRNEPDEFRNIL